MTLSRLSQFPDWAPKIGSRNLVFAHARNHVAHVTITIIIMSKTAITTTIARVIVIIKPWPRS